MKLKKGYAKFTDYNTNMVHIYPVEGRRHFYDNCWCKPTVDKKNGIIHHNEDVGQNNSYQCGEGEGK